jgi:hypothetical protein
MTPAPPGLACPYSYQTQGLNTPDDMRRQYREIAETLAPYVDVLLAETLSTAEEAAAAAEATAGLGALRHTLQQVGPGASHAKQWMVHPASWASV